MIVDKRYCMSSFLMYRTIVDRERAFSADFPPYYRDYPSPRTPIADGAELLDYLRAAIAERTRGRKVALALSGGIDSAILLALMPENTTAYTFKCTVPGVEVTDESPQAKRYLEAMRPDMAHRIVSISWADVEDSIDAILRHKGAPTHSIEAQIYKAALAAKADGCDLMVFGETADCIYGGHSQLLSRDWTVGEFANRWSFVMPHMALKDFEWIMEPYARYEVDGYVDVPRFLTEFESEPSLNFYMDACDLAGMELYAPYAHTIMRDPLDLARVRRGENKYIVREVFNRLYPGFVIPAKTPMPRPMNEWLKDWAGPARAEFWPRCTDNMTGDQKWLVWVLERFLNLIDPAGARKDER